MLFLKTFFVTSSDQLQFFFRRESMNHYIFCIIIHSWQLFFCWSVKYLVYIQTFSYMCAHLRYLGSDPFVFRYFDTPCCSKFETKSRLRPTFLSRWNRPLRCILLHIFRLIYFFRYKLSKIIGLKMPIRNHFSFSNIFQQFEFLLTCLLRFLF